MLQLYPKNKLILGDCLEVLRKMPPNSIDLIYLDPPFFSNRNYEVIWGDSGEVRSFQDRWAGGIDHYIGWLYDRVAELHRLLKPTGSIYLHCDWHADAYIRVMVLDKIFGGKNYKAGIVWQRTNAHNDAKKKLAVLNDTIWYYSKSDDFAYNPVYQELGDKYVKDFYKYDAKDGKGLYRLDNLAKPDNKGYQYDYKGYPPPANGWRCPIETMQELDAKGLLNFPKNPDGRISKKRYLSDSKGQLLGSIWVDIMNVQGSSRERIGYPTQKPLALLERIIRASSNEGDVVLDPFMGGGTSVVMASRLNRSFIGIDQSVAALDVTANRLNADGLFSNFAIEKHFYAEEDLKAMPHFEFERWIVTKFGGTPNTKQVGDHGSDGEKDGAPIQVKRWRNKVGRPEIQKFNSVCQAKSKFNSFKELAQPVGYFIAFDFAREAIEELARLKNSDGIIIEKVLVSDIVPLAKRPNATVTWRVLEDGRYEFTATSDSNIINFSWDFRYPVPAYKHPETSATLKPTVLFDKKGVQKHNFASSGAHNIAVRIVDDKCLENVVVCTVSV